MKDAAVNFSILQFFSLNEMENSMENNIPLYSSLQWSMFKGKAPAADQTKLAQVIDKENA